MPPDPDHDLPLPPQTGWPKSGEFYQHFKTRDLYRILFIGEDVTRPVPHKTVVYIPHGKKVDYPYVRRLTNFLQNVAPGVARFNRVPAPQTT